MTFLLFQAFLLMAAAYFLGAFLGCWWRRTFYAPIETRTMPAAEPVAAGAAISGAGALNVPRSDPIPVQPRIEYVDTPQTTVDRHRFERALSGVGRLEEDEVAGESEMPPPTASTPAPAVTEAAPHFEAAPRPPVTRAPIEDMPKPDLAAAKTTDDAMAAAAAAAAAAIGIAARSRAAAETTRRTAPPVVTAASVSHPVAASGGMAGVAADVRTPPLVPADSQDLKLIAGVDDAAERALHSLGVWRYADISRWTAGDVASVNAALGSQGRVQRQNWIEQAAVLAKGAHTLYARRRLRGELASAFPTETARPARGPVPGAAAEPLLPAEPTPASAPRSPQASASAAAVAVAAAAAAATRGRAAATGQRPLMPVRAPRPVISEIGSGPVPAAAEPPPAKSPPPPPAA
ncbi:MAG: hypothetical protein KDJ18_11855, partial [Hyphomicrobiaceae bacterium]|nr:hypothetical protein [Hyphomicrobiaceae bacterium]